MKDMTKKELIELGKDLKMAKVLVLHKHGFTVSEIASVLGTTESVIRKLIDTAETGTK